MVYALRHAQARYDALLPEDFEAQEDGAMTEIEAQEDGAMTEIEADDAAQDVLNTVPAVIADWLHNECCADTDPVDPSKQLQHRAHSECQPGVILAALMTCDREQMALWVYAMRERFAQHCAAVGWRQERAAELLAADQRERQRAADMAAQEYCRVD